MNPDDFNKMLELQAIIDEWEEDFDRNSQIEQIDNKYLQQIYNLIDTWREKDRETGISRMDLNKICPKCNFTYNQHVYTGYEWICPDIEKGSGGVPNAFDDDGNPIQTFISGKASEGISRTNLCPKCNGWGSVYNHREDSSIVYKCISCGKIFPPQEQASGGDSK